MSATILIGIDPGTETGLATKFIGGLYNSIETMPIHKAMDKVKMWATEVNGYTPYVVVEDARLRKWIPKEAGREVLQGVGSVKRDCSIWEDFLTDLSIPHRMVAPAAHRTKWNEKFWKAATGWTGRTSNHARDAAILVHGINEKNFVNLKWK